MISSQCTKVRGLFLLDGAYLSSFIWYLCNVFLSTCMSIHLSLSVCPSHPSIHLFIYLCTVTHLPISLSLSDILSMTGIYKEIQGYNRLKHQWYQRDVNCHQGLWLFCKGDSELFLPWHVSLYKVITVTNYP